MKREIVKFLVLAALALGAPPAYSAYWQWSKTTATNSAADPTINWAEGMSPSSINDSARAMMARMAEYRDDISGALTTSGTATAYTVTTNQGLPSVPTDGQLIAFTPNVDNGVGTTLRADGGTIYPIQTAPGVAVGAATLITGTPYSAKFSLANSSWILRDFYGNAFNVPLGGLLPYTGATAPNSNFILPAGQCISTTTYASYWALRGSPASGGCAGGQFAVIDMRGRAPVALDNLNGVAAGRLTNLSYGCGTSMTSVGTVCANENEWHQLTSNEMPSHFHTAGIYDPGHVHNFNGTGSPSISNMVRYGIGASFGGGGGSDVTTLTINSNATGVRINSTSNGLDNTYSAGNNAPHPIVTPVVGVTYLLRVI